MKRARVAYSGAVWDAVADPGGLRLSDGRIVSEEAVVWLPPVKPRAILALGLNYVDHAKELAFRPPEEPLAFLKGPNSLTGHRAVTRLPAGAAQMHAECELVAVIGRTARRVKRADASAYVAGYTVANDYAIRDYLENYYRPNLIVKNRDGATPLGPWLVDAADLPDPTNLALRTTVNGRLVQQGSTKDMIFDVPHLVEYFSSFMTLEPGDIILTGTPDGVAFLNSGDVVVAEIEGVGRLENRVLADEAYYARTAS